MEHKKLSFTILMDNIEHDDLVVEHGFSVLVEYGDSTILFDTGQSNKIITNAVQLGCELSKVDTLVLSHGHYDHTGGITALYQLNPKVKFVSHPAALTHSRYSLHPGQAPRMIAMVKEQRQVVESLPDVQRVLTREPYPLCSGLYFSGEIPRDHPTEDVGGPFYLDPQGKQADRLPDDASLWFQTEQGLIILTGCCHSGLINTVTHIQRESGEQRIVGIIGGLHLLHAGAERLYATAAAINEWRPEFVIACHCTGQDAIEQLRDQTDVQITQGYCGFKFSYCSSRT